MNLEAQLIHKLNKRDRTSLKTFFDSFYPSACVFADKYVKDINLAEDIAQEVFLSFWAGQHQFTNLQALKGFIYTSTKNLCLNHLRSKTIRGDIHKTLVQSEAFFHDLIVEEETYRLINQAVEKLPPQSRKIIRLFMNGYKNPEIAEELNISVNTVKTLKRNAYALLREILRDHLYILFILKQLFRF